MPIVAGVDSSTQSCTIELRDPDSGKLLARGRRPRPRTFPPVSEQNPADWWAAFQGSLHDALSAAGLTGGALDAISVGAQCHGLVAMDVHGRPLRPVKLWNDTTSSPQAAAMVARKGVEWWVRTVGSAPTAAFTITKLAWLAEHEPDLLRQVRSVCVPHDWLTYRLSGRHVTDRSDVDVGLATVEFLFRHDFLRRLLM